MRSRTVIENVGEYLGPIDWSYDFTQHNWGPGRGGINPEIAGRAKDLLRQLEQPGNWQVMMHQNYLRVIKVGMYDGWPFWRPVPSVMTWHVLGAEWSPWYDIQAVKPLASSGAAPQKE